MSNETVTISKSRLRELQEKEAFLKALEAAGVDNWNGYGHAHEIYERQMGKGYYR